MAIKPPNASRHLLRKAIRSHTVIAAENSDIIFIMKGCEPHGRVENRVGPNQVRLGVETEDDATTEIHGASLNLDLG
jgi:hypothetical protein